MRIAVVGSGAIGTWLGAALSRAGHEVTLIARGAHLAAMRADGVRITGSEEYAARPLAVADAEATGTVDVVLLCVKAHDQAATAPLMQRLLGPDTVVVAVQNGVPWWYFHGLEGFEGRRVESVDPGGAVSAAIAPERALGLVVYMGAAIVEPGVVSVHPEAGLVIGEPVGCCDSDRLETTAAALEGAGFQVRRTADIRTELWTKLMGNASFNPISLLTRAGLGTIASHPRVRAHVAAIMRECVEVARATGADPTISIEDRLAITARLGEHKTSTLQDLEAHKRVEIDALVGAVVELADAAGVSAPTLTLVYDLADLAARAQQRPLTGCDAGRIGPRAAAMPGDHRESAHRCAPRSRRHGGRASRRRGSRPSAAARAPRRASDVHPRQARQVRVGAGQQIAQRAAGEVRRRHAATDVPTSPAEAAGRVQADGRRPVARHSEHPAPGVVIATSATAGNKAGQPVAQLGDGARRDLAIAIPARPEAVRNAAAADRDAPVGGALQVEVRVLAGQHRLAAFPADRVPCRRRQRRGDDHRRVQRHQRAPPIGQRRRVPLGCPDHVACMHLPGPRHGSSGLDRRHRRRLEHAHTRRPHRVAQPHHELDRVDACTVLGEDPAERTRTRRRSDTSATAGRRAS